MARYRVAVMALAFALWPSTSAAQLPRFTADIFAGGFFPVSSLVEEVSGGEVLDFGHKPGWSVGGRVAVWVTRRFAVEAEGAYAGSNLKITNTELGIDAETFTAALVQGSVSAVYAIFEPPLEPVSAYLSGGVGIVSGTGDGYDNLFEDVTDITSVFGIGFRYGASPTVDIRVDFKDYVYVFEEESLNTDSKLQNNFLLTGGVSFKLGGR